jgi:hypothetical protein
MEGTTPEGTASSISASLALDFSLSSQPSAKSLMKPLSRIPGTCLDAAGTELYSTMGVVRDGNGPTVGLSRRKPKALGEKQVLFINNQLQT